MSRYRIVYLRKAQQDLIEIFSYIRMDRPSAAEHWLEHFESTVERLSTFPNSGLVPRDDVLFEKSYRFLVVDDYLAFYRVQGHRVQIYRILHGRRRYQFLLAR